MVFMEAVFLLFAAGYFFTNAADRYGYHFLDNVDLAIHETGHVFFAFLGEFLAMAGGTILQLLVPLAFAAYFFTRGRSFSAGIVMLWLGQSFINVARYAGDAVKMELPLVGGGMHDWNYLLSSLNILDKTMLISNTFYYSGVAIIVAGVIFAVVALSKGKE